MPLPNEIIEYYLTCAPYAHSDKPGSAQSLDLSSVGWEKHKLDKLMKWIVLQNLSVDGESRIRFSIANDVRNAPDDLFVVKGPSQQNENGGAFCIKGNLKANEDNSISCKLSETYATCFFRHIRNSIAHGNYEHDRETNLVMFKDQASAIGTKDPLPTAIFQTSIDFLGQLMKIVACGPGQLDEVQLSSAPSYRVNHRVEASIADAD